MKTSLLGTLLLGFAFIAFIASVAAKEPMTDRSGATDNDEIVLNFRGLIDGSEKIEISMSHAYWSHVDWSYPEQPVWLNGVSWDAKARPSLSNDGPTRFLPRAVDFKSARLKRIKGRNLVAVETRADSLTIRLNDTPNGSDLYEFDIVFRPRPVRSTLRVVAETDGSDHLHLDPAGARWYHGHWDAPKEVRLNGFRWYPQDPPFLMNHGATRYMEGPVDFSTARLTINEGRDTVALEHTPKGLIVHFADNPLGHANYDVTISFGD